MGDGICIRETVAVAVNTTDLSPDGRAVDIVGAMGAAAHNRFFDTTDGRIKARLTAAGTAEINPRRRIASLLERAKYGLDRSTIQPAVYLFIDYLRHRREYAGWRVRPGDSLIVRFAGRIVYEWLHDRCCQCGGAGQVAIGPIGQRNTRTKTCGLCHGRGDAKLDHRGRAQLLGVSAMAYERHWVERFRQAHVWLAAIEETNIAPLRSQLKRGTLPDN